MKKLAFCFRGQDSAGFWGGSARSRLCPPARSARRNAAAKGSMGLAILSLMAILGLMTVSVPANAAQSKGERIDEFIKCVNTMNKGKPSVDVSSTVACVPKDCSVTATTSEESAQPACKLAGKDEMGKDIIVSFPRVIFFCPNKETAGEKTFVPEYTLCPSKPEGTFHGRANRVEIGEVRTGDALKPPARLIMAHFDLNPGIPKEINPETAKNRVDNGNGTQGCFECHATNEEETVKDPPRADLLLSKSRNVFTEKVVFTNQKGKTNPDDAKFSTICDNISKINGLPTKVISPKTDKLPNKESFMVAINLCKAIAAYIAKLPPKGGIDVEANIIAPAAFKLEPLKLRNTFTITVTNNSGSVPVTIAIGEPYPILTNGDQKVFVTKIKTTGGTCLKAVNGNPLQPGQSCTVEVTFDTGRADSSPNPGAAVWDILTSFTFTDTNKPPHSMDLLPTVTVTVGP